MVNNRRKINYKTDDTKIKVKLFNRIRKMFFCCVLLMLQVKSILSCIIYQKANKANVNNKKKLFSKIKTIIQY